MEHAGSHSAEPRSLRREAAVGDDEIRGSHARPGLEPPKGAPWRMREVDEASSAGADYRGCDRVGPRRVGDDDLRSLPREQLIEAPPGSKDAPWTAGSGLPEH